MAIINPQIVESQRRVGLRRGLPVASPACTSRSLRPNEVLVRGCDLDGNEVEIEADELMGRLFQHELDHLNGVLMFDRMDAEQRKAALPSTAGCRRRRPRAPKRRCACSDAAP